MTPLAPSRHPRWGTWADVGIGLVFPVVVVGSIYLAPFIRDPTLMPQGADTRGYIWRAAVVRADGIGALADAENALGARPLHPVVVSLFDGTTGVPPLTWAVVLPAVLAVVIALAAGALATEGLGASHRAASAYAIGVGGSALVAVTARGYAANLFLDPMAIALVLLVVSVAFGRCPASGGIVLLAAATLAHYIFAAVLFGLLATFAAALLLDDTWPRAARPPSGAARRVWLMLAGGAAASIASFAISPQFPTHLPQIGAEDLRGNRVTTTLRRMRVVITLPVAALGGVLRLRSGTAVGRSTTAVLLLWAVTAPVAIVAWYVFDLPLPPYRWAGFALAIPILIVLAAVEVGERMPASRPGRVVAKGLLVLAAVGLASSGASVWSDLRPVISRHLLAQLRTVAEYVATLPPGTPVALTVKSEPDRTGWDRVAMGLPADVIDRLDLLPVAYDASRADLGIPAPPGGVVLWVEEVDRRSPPPGLALGPGVLLLVGPPPSLPLRRNGLPRSPPGGRLVGLAVIALVVLMVAGSGWAGLARTDAIGRAALAPTFGLAALGLLGLVASRLGVGFDRWGSLAIIAVTTALGWGIDQLSRHRGRRPPLTIDSPASLLSE